MTKCHFVEDAAVHPVNVDLESATPIFPLATVLVRLHAPRTDELPLPWEGGVLAFPPELALRVGEALVKAAQTLEQS